MKRIDFFSLERPVEERFVEATRGQGMPAPLLVAPLPLPFDAMRWAAAGVLLLGLWVWVMTLGYGKLESTIALQPRWMLILHVGLPVLAVLAGLRARTCLQTRGRLPFVPTVYLFPIGAVDARTHSLTVHGWEELTHISAQGRRARLAFAGGSFEFPLANAEQGKELEQRAGEYKQKLASGELPERELVLLDPLRDNGFRNPFSPVESMLPPRGKKIPLLELGCLLAAVALGLGAWSARNALGERSIYEHARTKDSIASYRAYLQRGGKREDVVDLLLPRAELRAAEQVGDVGAIERYMAAHPGSKIEGEVQAALRATLLKALDQARAKNSITALREYEQTYAKHLKLVPELPQARITYLNGVLERFQHEFKPNQKLWLLARRLIVHADKHGGSIAVRFAQQESRTLEKNQRLLTASAYYGGDKTLPSHYLVGALVRAAEQRAGADLVTAFARIFPPDLLHFVVGPPLEGAPPPTFSEPTLLVSYRLEISSPLVSKKPRAIFSGVGLIATATLSVPDPEPAYELKHTAWHAPDIRRIEAGELAVNDVYGDVLAKAFTRFTTRYMAPWLGKEPG